MGREMADIICDVANRHPAIPFVNTIVHIAVMFRENTNEELEDMVETNVVVNAISPIISK